MTHLLSNADLERSCVVANCRMNRERKLSGRNGYQRELGLAPGMVQRQVTNKGVGRGEKAWRR